jgi:lipopolysaccharide export system protein LptA
MGRAFRLTMRAGVVALIAVAAVLVLYSVLEEPRPRPVRSDGEPPATEHDFTMSRPEDTPVASAPGSRPDPAPGGVESVVIEEFSQTIQDPDRGVTVARIAGPQATHSQVTRIWQILEPVLTLDADPAGTPEGVDLQFRKVRVTAKTCVLDKDRGTAELSGGVTASGEDFHITTEHVVFRAADRSLSSDSHVYMRKDRTRGGPGAEAALTLQGNGARLDAGLSNLSILSGVEACLHDVSQDFLDGVVQQTEEEGPSDVTITSAGPMTYEHLARKITFSDDVVVVLGGKRLECNQLQVTFGQDNQTGELEVTGIHATTRVSLSYADQTLEGDVLKWRNITQTGSLMGTPASVETPEFRLSGQQVSFYRLNSRFDCNGPGRLVRKAPEEPASGEAAQVGAQVWRVTPFRVSGDTPVTISWRDSMSYDVVGRLAIFRGEVQVEQDSLVLTCDQIEAGFGETPGDVGRVLARGSVLLTDHVQGAGRTVACHELVWDAAGNEVELVALDGGNVTVDAGRQLLEAPRVVFDNTSGFLRCPAPGRLELLAKPTNGAAGPEEDLPVEVRWGEAMEFRQHPEAVATFTGAVVATADRESITADSLRVELGPDMAVEALLASGQVSVEIRPQRPPSEHPHAPVEPAEPRDPFGIAGMGTSDRWVLTCGELLARPSGQVMTCGTPGELAAFGESGEPSGAIRWQNEASIDWKELRADFRGQVQAEAPGGTVSSDAAVLTFSQDGRLRHIRCDGSVRFSGAEGGRELKSQSAEAVFVGDSTLRQFIARGDVEITDSKHALCAQRVVLYLDEPGGAGEPVVTQAVAQESVWLWYQADERLEAGGDRAEWDGATDTYVLTGEPYAYFQRQEGGKTIRVQNWKITLEAGARKVVLPPGESGVTTVLQGNG